MEHVWVTIQLFMRLTGLSEKATRTRIKDGRLISTRCGGRYIMVNIQEYYKSLEEKASKPVLQLDNKLPKGGLVVGLKQRRRELRLTKQLNYS